MGGIIPSNPKEARKLEHQLNSFLKLTAPFDVTEGIDFSVALHESMIQHDHDWVRGCSFAIAAMNPL